MTEGQILLESFLQALTAGALVGAIYGLMCVGLAMIFGIMRVINFAQGDFMMLGMYIAFYAFTLLGVQAAFGGIFGPYVAIAIAAPVLFAFGFLVHKALISVVVILLLWMLITRSRLGKSLRASADNPEASTYMGIDVDHAHRIAFALGTCITGIAGSLLATNYPFHPFVGLEYVIVMYAGVVLGGIGSIIGPFWGGMTIGLVQQLSTLVLPTQLQNATIFVIFLLIIVFRPQGFFGRVVERT